jgi:SAM-dependent methyltransferase
MVSIAEMRPEPNSTADSLIRIFFCLNFKSVSPSPSSPRLETPPHLPLNFPNPPHPPPRGRLLQALAQKGHTTVGLDISHESLEYARQRCSGLEPLPQLHQGDMTDFDLGQGRFALAFNLVSSFKYLLTHKAAASHLRCVYRALRPGGVYLLGLHVVDYEYHAEQGERERWHAERDNLTVDAKIFSSVPDPVTRTEDVAAFLKVVGRPGEGKGERGTGEDAVAHEAHCEAPAAKGVGHGGAAHGEAGHTRRLLCRFAMRTYNVVELFELIATCGVPFEVAEVYDFNYRLSDPREDDSQLAVLLVLRRPPGEAADVDAAVLDAGSLEEKLAAAEL